MAGLTRGYRAPAAGVAERLEAVRGRLRAAGGDPEAIRIVAVTKGFAPAAVAAATAAGLADVGENYAGELLDKARATDGPGPGLALAPRWHFLGAVQRNKVRALAPVVHLWQGLTRLVEGEEIARWAPGARVLVQVELAGRADRQGVAPEEVPPLVAGLRRLDLEVRGLMAVGLPGPPEGARAGFAHLACLAGELGLPEVSMGMSDDLEVAVEEGSTMVRLGRALFGPRPAPSELRE